MTELILPPEIQAERERAAALEEEIAAVFTMYWQWELVQDGVPRDGVTYQREETRRPRPITDDPEWFYHLLLRLTRGLKLRVAIAKALGRRVR